MVKVININGNLVELPEPSAKLSKAESPDGRFSKPKNKISKIQRAELRMKFGGRCAYCGCKLPEKGWHADHVEPVRRDFELVRAPVGSGVTHVARSTGKVMHPELHAIENLFPSCAPC
ncbi:HNH endonuclease, partial [Salmonella enterica]|nr:HNH endonuclease [Salmonella enterica]